MAAAKSTKTAATAKRPRGRPRVANPLPNVTGLRIPPELVADLDAWAAELDASGPGRVTRSSLIVHVLREAVARWRAEKAAKAGAP